MKESCKTCALKLTLENYDYSGGGCTHTAVDGYACMAFQTDGVAVWMTGNDEDSGRCEMYRPKEWGNNMHRLRDESYSEDLLELHEESRKAADVVEVVRCKDCGHWWSYTGRKQTRTDCREWDYCQKNRKMKPEDGFCHEGERRK